MEAETQDSPLDVLFQLLKFATVSSSGTLLNLAFIFFTSGNVVIRFLIGYFIQITNNFYWNRRITFEYTNQHVMVEYFKFVLTMSTGGVVYTLLSVFLITNFGIIEVLAGFLSVLVSGLINFSISRIWVFRQPDPSTNMMEPMEIAETSGSD